MDKNLLIYPESSNDMDDSRRGKDEMNLAVLPIAKLGRSDSRDIIEYHGTFSDKDGQKEMVWIVRGAAGLGLPNELGDWSNAVGWLAMNFSKLANSIGCASIGKSRASQSS